MKKELHFPPFLPRREFSCISVSLNFNARRNFLSAKKNGAGFKNSFEARKEVRSGFKNFFEGQKDFRSVFKKIFDVQM